MLTQRLQEEFPELHLNQRAGIVVVAGSFLLVDGQEVVDRYKVEIEVPKTYPKGIPVLREVGGRIPRDLNRHVESDGKACVFLPDEYCYRHPDGMDLIDFLKGPVLGFFVGQSLVECGQPWPQGERRHGEDGVIEFYGELLGTNDRRVIRCYLEVLAAEQLRGHWECPCGGGKRIRQCHRERLVELRTRISRSVARGSLARISPKVRHE